MHSPSRPARATTHATTRSPQSASGHADDRDLGDRLVLAKRLFDLERAELVAAALQDIDARAPEDAQVAVRLARDGVAGLEPALARVVDERLARRLGPVAVAREDAGAADPELAGVGVSPVVADDARADRRQRAARPCPGRRPPGDSGLLAPTPISVMPKRSSGYAPERARQRSPIVTGSAALPLVMRRSACAPDAQRARVAASASSNAARSFMWMVGTPMKTVARGIASHALRAIEGLKVRRRAGADGRQQRDAEAVQVMQRQARGGGRRRRCHAHACARSSCCLARFACVMTAPLGLPVVPLV